MTTLQQQMAELQQAVLLALRVQASAICNRCIDEKRDFHSWELEHITAIDKFLEKWEQQTSMEKNDEK